jgi:outer membrane protein OmpA-like peptidoglycan-associated protein
MKTKILILVMILIGVNTLSAQKKTDDKSKNGNKTEDKAKKEPVEDTDPNMIVNGSFEQVDLKLLKGRGQLHLVCKPWMSVCKTGADMYAAGNSKNKKVNAPENDYGNQIAQDGNNYAGFIGYSKDPKINRTYLIQKLKKTLKKDQLYCATMSVCLSENSKLAVNNIGMVIGDKKFQFEDDQNITVPPTIVTPANRAINDMDKWTTICVHFYAKGNENFVTIGGFGNDGDMKFEKIKSTTKPAGVPLNGAYYFVDNVSIVPINAKSECNCGKNTVVETDYIYSRSNAKADGMKPEQLIAATAIYFSKESAAIPAQFEIELEDAVKILTENPSIQITLTGHADLEEMEEAKVKPELKEIAKERAEAVKAALIERGIAGTRITTDSKDANELANTKGTPMSKAQNRRVIFGVR